jgi:alkanesulfonate monooxygenase SsuD/methylene tetrahydromethanopterin reductase-like flavin-dependent oxidoreductase (luciferase family)
VAVPSAGPIPDGGGLIEIGSAAELAGADSLWVSDRLPDGRRRPARRTPWLRPPPQGGVRVLDVLRLSSGGDNLVQVGTASLVLPQRNVLELAKTAASLHRMSAGRFVLGVGTGSSPGRWRLSDTGLRPCPARRRDA